MTYRRLVMSCSVVQSCQVDICQAVDGVAAAVDECWEETVFISLSSSSQTTLSPAIADLMQRFPLYCEK